MDFDVIVVGSGGAGLCAALAAASGGARVKVIEASHRWGGSTAVSGGQGWVPANHRMADLGVSDSVDEALAYRWAHAAERPRELIDAFVHAAPRMARFVEAHTPIVWRAMRGPDSFAELAGGKMTARHLEVSPLAIGELGPPEEFWTPTYPTLFTNDEVFELRLPFGGAPPMDLIQQRSRAGHVCMGLGLVAGLMRGCTAAGVELERNARARRLLRELGGLRGVVVEREAAAEELRATRGVVLATGGFEWAPEVREALLRGPVTHPVSPPLHRGDGLRMAAEAGAGLAYTSESWCWPAQEAPASQWDGGEARHLLVMSERFMPHVIWVNREGRRFVNESSHNCALSFDEVDPQLHERRNVPAWAIADSRFRSRYPFAGAAPSAELPTHALEAKSLAELAAAAGIDPGGLERSVARFNEQVQSGRDADFARGETADDRFYGDPTTPHPNLGTVEVPPFYAMRVYAGAVGTKGGARTDARARVVGWDGQPIGGLWAAGNAMASAIGPGTIAPGLTLGLALTFGYLAGMDAASPPEGPAHRS
jgi:succinate dehydrogenase/fumarate reductase flavoprotein subunit